MMDVQALLKQLDAMFARGETDRVEPFLLGGLQQALSGGDGGAVLTIINELIGFYRSVGMHDRAMLFSRKGLELMRSMGVGGVDYGTALVNAATACRAGGALVEALSYYREAEALYRAGLSPEDMRMAGFYNNFGLLHREMGAYGEAERCFECALQVLQAHLEAHVERANTRVNRAGALLKQAAEIESSNPSVAQELVERALVESAAAVAEFERHCPADHHFDAALAIRGDALMQAGRAAEAVPFYERALEIRGKNPMAGGAYRALWDKLSAAHAALGHPDALKGMNLSREDFLENGLPLLQREFPELLDQLAAGLVGEGSECFGFDDATSIDHDFGVGFCLFVPKAVYGQWGEALERAYASLPETFHGVRRKDTANGRTGVIVLEEFLERWTGSPDGVPDWNNVEEYRLATAVNGEIFFDPSGRLTSVRRELSQGYPPDVWRRRLAQKLMEAAQSGQYNYGRMMARGDYTGARLALKRFCERALEALYLLEGRYAPYYKWLWRGMAGHPLAAGLAEMLSLGDQRAVWRGWDAQQRFGQINRNDRACELIEEFASGVARELRERGLTRSTDGYLEVHAWELMKHEERKGMDER